MAQGQKSKLVEVKLLIDGDIIRLRVKSRGQVLTQSMLQVQHAAEWLKLSFTDLLVALKTEAANGTTR